MCTLPARRMTVERRLAAILVADVVGYSTLMEQDESGTLASVSRIVAELIEPLISGHRGRIVKLMGDGVLAEFSSVVDAVECATAWQEQVADDPSGFEFRIGVNLGDIMVQGGDIFGNGVNVAARLESMAESGGICVSGTVHAEVKNKLDLAFEDLGFPTVKNIAEPVQVFRIASESTPKLDEVTRRPHAHEKPSIAVLAFTNMSGDPDQDYFSDGVSEDIITGLARFRTLVVIARNSSFSFRGQNRSITEIGDELGVQYVVEGSVRRVENRVRISAQLVETDTGTQLWADRFDREVEDVFAVQDEVASSIVAVLPGRVQHDVADRAARKPTSNMKAYELLLQGKALRDGLNAQDTAKARLLYEKALELDPSYARVYMYLADTYVVDSWLGLADTDAPRNALEIARKGAALDNRDVFIQDQLGYAYLCSGLWEDADAQFERTLSQIVNEAESMAWCGYGFLLLGRQEKAAEVLGEAIRLDPMHPPALDWILGQVHFFEGRYDDVVRVLIGEALLNSLAHAFLVAAYALSGRQDEAQVALHAFIQFRRTELESRGIAVDANTSADLTSGFRGMWRNTADCELLLEGLRLAGLPD